MASLAGWQTRQSNFKSVTGNFSRKPLLISSLQLVEPQTLGQQWDSPQLFRISGKYLIPKGDGRGLVKLGTVPLVSQRLSFARLQASG